MEAKEDRRILELQAGLQEAEKEKKDLLKERDELLKKLSPFPATLNQITKKLEILEISDIELYLAKQDRLLNQDLSSLSSNVDRITMELRNIDIRLKKAEQALADKKYFLEKLSAKTSNTLPPSTSGFPFFLASSKLSSAPYVPPLLFDPAKQDKLVEACAQGNLCGVKDLLTTQSASLYFPNSEELYPLPAAIYSCNPYVVEYVESHLKSEEAETQWEKVDLQLAKEKLKCLVPPDPAPIMTYGDLGRWYGRYKDAPWAPDYDRLCLVNAGITKWGVDDIVWNSIENLWGPNSLRAKWHLESTLWASQAYHGGWADQGAITVTGIGTPKALTSPSARTHSYAVNNIRYEIAKLNEKVQSKEKELKSKPYVNSPTQPQ